MSKFNDRSGEIRTGNYGLMKIIEYTTYSNITVKFKTGSIVKTSYGNFKNGITKDPLFPSIYNVGYFGIGKYKAQINGKNTLEYQTWHNMIQRCYDPHCMNRQPTYQNTTVCKSWHNFQNFAEWFHKNYYKISDERIELDKDLIKKGNKIYCPEFCSFVPKSINLLLTKSDKARGKYPIGVIFRKENQKYTSQLSYSRNRRVYLGYFSSPLQAFNAYKIAKEKQIKIMTNKFREVLNINVYNFLMQYEVLITD